MFTLPPLTYQFDALDPYIDAQTMQLHHGKHHQGYIDKLNAALAKHPDLAQQPIEALLTGIAAVPQEIRQTVQNHGGGHHNHSLFWTSLTANAPAEPTGPLADGLKTAFTDFSTFKHRFTDTAAGHFGSGWAWLVATPEKQLELYSLPNQDSPLMQNHIPLLGLDVWEHAYYLKYQNRRPEYIDAFWHLVNWPEVETRYHNAVGAAT